MSVAILLNTFLLRTIVMTVDAQLNLPACGNLTTSGEPPIRKCHIHELKNVVTTVRCSTMLVEEDGAHPLVGLRTVVSLSR